MPLKSYRRKRNFEITPEPKGRVSTGASKQRRYLIQKHAASHLHYDFRLELRGVLLSWAVPKGPCLDPTVRRLAVHVEDHPLDYGTFEGIIPKGQYGGGTVMLWDQGIWISEDPDSVKAYQKGHLIFTLYGEKLKGKWQLVRMDDNDKTWLLIKGKDKYAKPLKDFDITIAEPNSVTTHRTLDDIANKKKSKWKSSKNPFPSVISPELATLVDKPPIGKEWLHEIKFDGYRLIAKKRNNKTALFTRNHLDWTHKFKNIANAINQLPVSNAIFDGEVVVLDENQHTDFQLLQNSLKEHDNSHFIYYIFDLIYHDESNLSELPLIERKQILKSILSDEDDQLLRYSDHVAGSGAKVFANACKLSLEGIVSKRADSPYIQKRTKDWLKVKCIKRQEFVIGGYTKPQGQRGHFGSLLIGAFDKHHQLIYHGHVGTGFTASSLESLHKLLEKNKSNKNPFNSNPPGMKNVVWVKPVLIAEVEFTEWTKDEILRHPSFKGLRSDKMAKNINKEQILPVEKMAKKDYKLTHPNKILYPEDKITKLDLANYYESVQDFILPYITDRPLTLVRCPDGYEQCFYQKHLNKTMPKTLHGILIKEKSSKETCIYLNDVAGLMSLPQLGVLEIHPWGSRIDNIEEPDTVIFDLDPGPNVKWKQIVEAAFEIRSYLADLKLTSFVKTTGGKGLHVVVPIKPDFDWAQIKNFTHGFADYLVTQKPKDYIDKMTKSARSNKIFVDYLRNQRGATAVGPYSTRARLHAPVATPIDWDELTDNIKDTYFTIKTIPKRLAELKKDPWRDYFRIKQKLRINKLNKLKKE